jgi:hypothetical protein
MRVMFTPEIRFRVSYESSGELIGKIAVARPDK